MKFTTLISALATASLAYAYADHRAHARSPHGNDEWQAPHLAARSGACPKQMCKEPASQGPNVPPACGNSYAECKFDQFPCDDHFTPKFTTNTHHCYCILANKKAMDAYCQERGFKSGNNPWTYHYAVQCNGAANDKVCNDWCQFQELGNGRINKANPNGPCACDQPWPSADFC